MTAAALSIEKTGGRLGDSSGNQFSIWGTETLASNGFIHDEAVNVADTTASACGSLTEI